MTENYERLIKLLKELFQIDRPDLDFGIYRIMNQKRDEITTFLDKDLLPQVQKAFASYGSGGRSDIQAELDKMVANLKDAGIDPDSSPKVQELKDKLNASVDVTELENEVYSHLYNFFRRYYKDGDFLSLRRYKKDVYAIPYEGEEVKLHWANADQYYIKSSENFRDYTFKLGELPDEGKKDNRKTVHFKLVEADTELANNKAQEGKERRFVLCSDSPMLEEDGELIIRFEYKPLAKKQRQKNLNESAVKTLLSNAEFADWVRELAKEESGTSVLAKHLNTYTAKNSFDYFIHKDLGGFLRRELDFFIKNEVMHLDDIEEETAPRVEQYLSQIKVLRLIAHKIIRFLEQLENFQKKLWLKKKFVVETNYCITLDRVPEELYPEICTNDAQREEWVRLFAIDEIQADLHSPGFSRPLTAEFLKANTKMVLDTRFFDDSFKARLVASIENFDEQCDGLLIHSENFQALHLLNKRYRDGIKCVYFDPPYNTGDDGFVYKDSYQSSSWSSMMNQVVQSLYSFLQEDGSLFTNCDENEFLNFGHILQSVFGKKNHVETITWNKRVPKNDKGIGNIHEYIYLFAKNQKARRSNERGFVMRKDALEEIYEIVKKEKSKGSDLLSAQKALKKFYKKQGFDRGITLYCELDPNFEIFGKINMSWPNAKTEGPRYEVINPATGKPAPTPDRGWRWKEETFRKAEKDGPTFELPDGSIVKGRIWYSPKENIQPSSITYLKEVESFLLRSIISLKSDGSIQLENLGLGGLIDYPKPVKLSEWIFYSTEEKSGYFLDCFAGSGTAAHGLLSLNREYPGDRKYILVEMGNHFDTVLKPRIAKVVYSESWKDGKPTARHTGVSHCFKYIRLESYEDTLNNLEFKQSDAQGGLLSGTTALKEEYMLSYMMDLETEGSASLLNVDRFDDPWNYTMKIATGSAGETKVRPVDLVETFNYLIGLTVIRRDFIRGIEVIEGTNPEGENVLVIWRNTKETSNEQLDEFFRKQDFNTRDSEFDLIYVNGDNNLENLKKPDETWKVRLIEEDFKRLMFEVEDV
jgi:adenine-specific DNA-methyltransferase